MILPFAEWLPDLPDMSNPGATRADNVIPSRQSYLPFPSLATVATGIAGRVQGCIFARDASTNVFNYAGDASALYSLANTSYTSVSRLVGGAYTTPVDDYWEFVSWGQTVIAVNGTNGDVPQQISLGAANFAALAGNPPKARHIATVRDFVVMGNISDSAQGVQRVRWSAINNATSWTPDAATLADFQELPGEGGWIQKIVSGEVGIVLQERAIWRMAFVGSPLVFQFDRVVNGVGALAPQSVVTHLNLVFFLGPDGFYMFDGSTLTPIGRGRVDATFFDEIDTGVIYRITAAIDPINKLVAWAYPITGNMNGNPNRILIYSWAFDRWSVITDMDIQMLRDNMAAGFTLDSLDSVSGSLDALGPSLDSREWTGGTLHLSAFSNANALQRFTGAARAAVVETAEHNFHPTRRSTVNWVRPLVQGSASVAQVVVLTRDTLTQATSASVAVSPIASGECPTRASGRYMRFRVQTTEGVDFDHIIGVEVEPIPEGVR